MLYLMYFPLTKDKSCVQFTKPTNINYPIGTTSLFQVLETVFLKAKIPKKPRLQRFIKIAKKAKASKVYCQACSVTFILVTLTPLLLLCCIFLSHQCRVQVWPGCKAILQQCSDWLGPKNFTSCRPGEGRGGAAGVWRWGADLSSGGQGAHNGDSSEASPSLLPSHHICQEDSVPLKQPPQHAY